MCSPSIKLIKIIFLHYSVNFFTVKGEASLNCPIKKMLLFIEKGVIIDLYKIFKYKIFFTHIDCCVMQIGYGGLGYQSV